MSTNPIVISAKEEVHQKTLFGFWVYLMTDLVLFATLFATYAVLRNNTYGGPGAAELFSMPFVLVETLLLLTSSFICGLALVAMGENKKRAALKLLAVVFLLGAGFLSMELYEFRHLVNEGNSWRRSGFLSAFFTLVGTHGLHILTGLIWLSVLSVRIYRSGFNAQRVRQLSMFGMFWHFLDVVWIFIFTIVYLMGVS